MLGVETLSMLEHSNNTDLGVSKLTNVYHHKPKGFRPQLEFSLKHPSVTRSVALDCYRIFILHTITESNERNDI